MKRCYFTYTRKDEPYGISVLLEYFHVSFQKRIQFIENWYCFGNGLPLSMPCS